MKGPFPNDLADLNEITTSTDVLNRMQVPVFDPSVPNRADPKVDRRYRRFSFTILLAWLMAQTIRSTSAAIGYATGAGGAVTQITSSATGVTLDKACGQITTVALTTAAAAEEEFVVTNSLVAATDVIGLSTTYAGAGTPVLSVKGVAAGSFTVVITNVHAANALNAAMVINFAVTKAVAA